MEILEKDVNERKMEPVKDNIGVLSLHVIHMKRFPVMLFKVSVSKGDKNVKI